jgi:hypothetical protein
LQGPQKSSRLDSHEHRHPAATVAHQILHLAAPPLARPPCAQIHHEARLCSTSPSIMKLTCISCSKQRPSGVLPLRDSPENNEDDNAATVGRADSAETPSTRQALKVLTAQVAHCSWAYCLFCFFDQRISCWLGILAKKPFISPP